MEIAREIRGHLAIRLRPLARRRLKTSRPVAVFILFKNPCLLLPFKLDGAFKVFFIICKL